MITPLFRFQRRSLRRIVFPALAIALAVPSVVPTVRPATALPTSCRVITYYQTAAMETVVGVRTNCPGSSNTGRTSPHREVETVTLDAPGPGPVGGGSGKLPCEFLAKGCGNLPVRRN